MSPRSVSACVAFLLLALSIDSVSAADTKKAKNELNDLSLEVAALHLIYQFEFTPAQLQALAKLASNTAATTERKPVKGSEKLRGLLIDLRTALRKHDDRKIDELTDKVEELKEKEKVEFDDSVEPTDAARKTAVEAARLLSARQSLDYLNLYDDLPDPMTTVRETLKKGLKLKDKDWTSIRDEAADDVAWMVAGIDKERAAKVRQETVALLDKAHAWKEAELTEQQPELEKAVQALVGPGGAADVLRHIIERDLAELLANPQLLAAIEGRLQR